MSVLNASKKKKKIKHQNYVPWFDALRFGANLYSTGMGITLAWAMMDLKWGHKWELFQLWQAVKHHNYSSLLYTRMLLKLSISVRSSSITFLISKSCQAMKSLEISRNQNEAAMKALGIPSSPWLVLAKRLINQRSPNQEPNLVQVEWSCSGACLLCWQLLCLGLE